MMGWGRVWVLLLMARFSMAFRQNGVMLVVFCFVRKGLCDGSLQLGSGLRKICPFPTYTLDGHCRQMSARYGQ